MSEDPIEELFRQRSKDSANEKPRDLVWKRIETGLQNQEKKKKPLKEFVSSVWFSAAVFALIAIPYFVLFLMNLGTNNDRLIEIVKTEVFLKDEAKTPNEKIEVIEMRDLEEEPLSIVKNDEVDRFSQKIIPTEPKMNELGSQEEVNSNERLIPDISLLRTQTLDSIEKNDQLALSSKLRKFSTNNDSIKESEKRIVIRGYSSMPSNLSSVPKNPELDKKIEDLENKLTTGSKSLSPEESDKALQEYGRLLKLRNDSGNTTTSDKLTGIISDKKIVNNADNIIYKPLKFVAKTDIVRTSFRLEKKSNNKITFVNKTVTISFEKTADKIILRTNEPKMNPNLVSLLEKNKKEIFAYYQK